MGDDNTRNFETTKLYMPEEMKYAAIVKYEQKGQIPLFMLILSLVLLAGAALGVTFAAPKILKVLDNFLTSLFQK